MANIDSSTVDYNQGSAGAVVRTVDKRLQDFVSVKDFGAVGNGVHNDQTAIQNAVNRAYQEKFNLLWPDGTYVSDSSIVNFWGTKHIGRGVIKRGTTLYSIEPGTNVVNVIHYSPTGNNLNDGLDNQSPRNTLLNAAAMLRQLNQEGKLLSGQWELRFAAGKYTDQTLRIDFPAACTKPVRIIGTKDEHELPATIIQKQSTSDTACIWIEPCSWFHIENFKAVGISIKKTTYGFLHKNSGKATYKNCIAEQVNIGFAGVDQVQASYDSCVALNVREGFRTTYNSQATVGASPETACTVTNAYYAFYCSRGSVAHCDYLNASDISTAVIQTDMSARTALVGGNYKRSPVGVRTWGCSEANVSGGLNFNSGTADAVTIPIQSWGAGGALANYFQNSHVEHRLAIMLNLTPSNGNTGSYLLTRVKTSVNDLSIPAYYFVDPTKSIRIKIWGERTGVVSNDVLTVRAQNKNTGASLGNLSSTIIAPGNFLIETEITALTPNTQLETKKWDVGNLQDNHLLITDRSVDFTEEAIINIYTNTLTQGNIFNVKKVEVFMMG